MIERREVDISLLREQRNPNKMSKSEYNTLVELIKKWGFLQPILVARLADQTFRIVDGHHRTKAARDNGYARVDAVIFDCEEDAQQFLQIAMNKVRGALDLNIVEDILKDLVIEGWKPEDLKLSGFDADEIEALLKPPEQEVPTFSAEEEPEPIASVVKPFVLEIQFSEKSQYQFARKTLKKLSGGEDYAVGLLKILGHDDGDV